VRPPQEKISEHYAVSDLEDRILSALAADGKDVAALTVDDLAPVDEFHLRGRVATEELAQWAAVGPEHLLLDVGSGLGGTSRYLATTTGCDVVGVDLTEEYCRVAKMLSDRVGLAQRTVFRHGSALALPFTDGRFDVVWTEHVQMNIADKTGFYRELGRTLKPGGKLAFHDIFAGSRGELHYPVPWAGDESISHLTPADELRGRLSDQGFSEIHWEDKTRESAAFLQTVLDRVRNEGWMPVGLHLLMGDRAEDKFANVLRNLEEDRARVVQAVLRLGGPGFTDADE